MKKIILSAAIIFSSCLMFKPADAQLKISLGLNIGSQPDWGPVGYDHADYYYIPDVDAYYDVPNHQYVYFENNSWVHRPNLPARYANYDLYSGYKVVVNQRNPWLQHTAMRAKYANFRGRRGGQPVIRDSRDSRYRDHWKGNNNGPGRDNNHGGGRPGGNDHGHGGHDNHGHDDHHGDKH